MRHSKALGLVAFLIWIGCEGTSVETESAFDKQVRTDLQAMAKSVTTFPNFSSRGPLGEDEEKAPAKRSAVAAETCDTIDFHQTVCAGYDSLFQESYVDTQSFFKADGVTPASVNELFVSGFIVSESRQRSSAPAYDEYSRTVAHMHWDSARFDAGLDSIVGSGYARYKADDFLLTIDSLHMLPKGDSLAAVYLVSFLDHKYTSRLDGFLPLDDTSSMDTADTREQFTGDIVTQGKSVGSMHVLMNGDVVFRDRKGAVIKPSP